MLRGWNTEGSGVTDPVKHVCPTLHSDALEHRQHSKQEVVEVGDAAIGTVPAFSAQRIVHEAGSAMTIYCTGSWVVLCYHSYIDTLRRRKETLPYINTCITVNICS